MRVLVDAALFESSQVSALDLAALFRMAAEGQHVILPEPLEAPAFESWRERQDPAMREEIEFALEHSFELESRQPPAVEIRVEAVEEPAWQERPAASVLPLDVALDLLARPLVVLVENIENDAAFLRCLADRFQREELEMSKKRGWLRFDHGGGLAEMSKTMDREASDPIFRRRTWLLFDSDALAPSHPSRDSRDLERKCTGLDVAYHQLSRRAAENYLPPAALEKGVGHSEAGKRRARAFRRLTLEQRSHFNVKHGFAGDVGRVEQESRASAERRKAVAARSRLFSGIPEEDLHHLRPGFGPAASSLFSSPEVLMNHGWFRDDASVQEMHPVIERLLNDR